METILAVILAIVTILAPGDAVAQSAPWDGSYGSQCCTCCEGGTVVGRERQCVTTTLPGPWVGLLWLRSLSEVRTYENAID